MTTPTVDQICQQLESELSQDGFEAHCDCTEAMKKQGDEIDIHCSTGDDEVTLKYIDGSLFREEDCGEFTFALDQPKRVCYSTDFVLGSAEDCNMSMDGTACKSCATFAQTLVGDTMECNPTMPQYSLDCSNINPDYGNGKMCITVDGETEIDFFEVTFTTYESGGGSTKGAGAANAAFLLLVVPLVVYRLYVYFGRQRSEAPTYHQPTHGVELT